MQFGFRDQMNLPGELLIGIDEGSLSNRGIRPAVLGWNQWSLVTFLDFSLSAQSTSEVTPTQIAGKNGDQIPVCAKK